MLSRCEVAMSSVDYLFGTGMATMRTVILAAGDFPKRGGEPYRLLASARCVVACDGAADAYRREFGRWPDAVVGDLDSASAAARGRAVRIPDQDTNDLSKAISWCRSHCCGDPVILGATGKREDHTIGNIYRALEAGVRVVTDFGEFLPVRGTVRFRTWKGAGVSVFTSDPRAKMSSRGLRWKLDGLRFSNAWCATLNRASSETVEVTSDRAAFVYVERSPTAVRAAVSLGSNLGDRAANLRRALKALSRLPGTRLLDASSVVETEPVGVPREFSALMFLNQAALFETELGAHEFSRAMHGIEDKMGRVRTVRNGPRTIDIDLVDFGGQRMRTRELTLPHPRAAERDFVVRPLRELGVEL